MSRIPKTFQTTHPDDDDDDNTFQTAQRISDKHPDTFIDSEKQTPQLPSAISESPSTPTRQQQPDLLPVYLPDPPSPLPPVAATSHYNLRVQTIYTPSKHKFVPDEGTDPTTAAPPPHHHHHPDQPQTKNEVQDHHGQHQHQHHHPQPPEKNITSFFHRNEFLFISTLSTLSCSGYILVFPSSFVSAPQLPWQETIQRMLWFLMIQIVSETTVMVLESKI
ncbi:hypothetical protein HDU97_004670, partial [Phlyctochytrium planicorne]